MAMSNHRPFLFVVAVVVVLGMALGCLRDSAGSLSVSEVYDRMIGGMSEEGYVLHTIVSTEIIPAEASSVPAFDREFWLDVPNDSYRVEASFENEGVEETSVQVFVQGVLFLVNARPGPVRVQVDVPGHRCVGSDRTLLFDILDCAALAQYNDVEQDIQVEQGRTFNGSDALVVRFGFDAERTADGELFVTELYIDPETFLPIARVSWLDPDTEVRRVLTFAHEFLPREELPSDFFDPPLEWTDSLDSPFQGPDD